jgi:rod shape-determining protein MreC
MVFGSTTGELRMRFVPQNSAADQPLIAEGDLVYTAGLSRRFPPLLLIGQVVEVEQSDERTHQEAVIRPSVDFGSLELVLVVNDWLPASATASEEDRGSGQ